MDVIVMIEDLRWNCGITYDAITKQTGIPYDTVKKCAVGSRTLPEKYKEVLYNFYKCITGGFDNFCEKLQDKRD